MKQVKPVCKICQKSKNKFVDDQNYLGLVDQNGKQYLPYEIGLILQRVGIDISRFILHNFPIISTVFRPEQKAFAST